MKQFLTYGLIFTASLFLLTACGKSEQEIPTGGLAADPGIFNSITDISLSEEEILVDKAPISSDSSASVYSANDIVFYRDGQDFTYGEGTEQDEHSQEEADAHTVVHITAPGTYRITGSLSAGQIAVDLGEDSSENPEAVVNLILDNADITCRVAPAVIFYNVYECGNPDTENASANVDTSAAGANIILADNSENTIHGSYVARIYKSYELNEEGTEVVESKKLHKYDGAVYSKMSMNVYGENEGNGILNIYAENEGLDSELHLTVNSGIINITSGNDGINTNEDEVSVTTINGGTLNILVSGETGEGDGIDSNGWIVINGGTVTAQACSISGDAGIDSDMGIHINGGTVLAGGNMFDQISESSQAYLVFQFQEQQKGGSTYSLKNASGDIIATYRPDNDFSYFVFSSSQLTEGTYSFFLNDTILSVTSGGMHAMGPEKPMNEESVGEAPEPPEGREMPDGEKPEMPDDREMPGGEKPEMPDDREMPGGEKPEMPDNREIREIPDAPSVSEASTEFEITDGGNYFMVTA